MGIEIFCKHLREKRAIVISSGANNLNLDNVAKICRAAQMAKASAVDIASNKDVYETARKNTKLPIFVSSYHPFEILEAVKMGVDGINIGNYMSLYKKGNKFSADEIYDVVLETMGLINNYDVYKTFTIPASLSLNEQVYLLKKLEVLGIDLIVCEGYKKSPVNPSIMVESADLAIKSMQEFSKYFRLPMAITSAMNPAGQKSAFENGASAVFVNNIISKMDSEVSMKQEISQMVGNISYRNSLRREIVKNSSSLLFNGF